MQRFGHFGQALEGSGDHMTLGIGGYILRPGLDGRFHHRILGAGRGRIDQLADPVEHERDGVGLAEVAAVLAENGPHVGRGAVPVVGQHLDDEADAAGTEALVADLFHIVGVAGAGLLDRPVDVVLGHALGLGADDRQAQARVRGGIRHAGLGRQSDVA